MSERYLPIQFFEKRKDFDDRSTEGGGDNRIPGWVLSGEALTKRSSQLTTSVSDLYTVFSERKRQGCKLPLIVSTAIEEKAIAKSHRGDITSLYASGSVNNVLGFSGNRCLLSMVYNEDVFERINHILADTCNHAKVISSIVDIAPYAPPIDEYDANMPYYKIRLVN